MAFRKTLCIAALVSLGAGGAVFFLSPHPALAGAVYGLLTLDAAYPDRFVGDTLAGLGAGPPISESTQWVFVDDFGALTRVPLDRYEKRLEPFDPRNDGYAEKLRSFFVREGKRRFFIPLAGQGPEFSRTLEARLRAALGTVPFSLELLGSPAPRWGDSPGERVLFALAAAGFLFFSGSPLAAAFTLPLLAVLCLTFPGGFAVSAALAALFYAQGGLLREWFTARRYGGRGFFPRSGGRGAGFAAVPALAALWGIYGLAAWTGGAALLPALAGAGAFCLVLTAAFWAESNRGAAAGHIRFLPVPIRNPGIGRFFPAPGALPFGLAALIALVLPGFFSAPPPAPEDEDYTRIRREYQNHAAFQASFSRRPLGGGGGGEGGYFRYRLDGEGLIAAERESPGDPGGGFSGEELPPFPLEDLLVFLETHEKPAGFSYTERGIFSALTGFALGLPALFRAGKKRRRGKGLYLYTDKRIAA
jgi:hypothetical protein